MATRMQRRLVGEGAGERREKVNRLERDWKAMLAGETWDRETLAEGMREMYRKVAILIIGSTIVNVHCTGMLPGRGQGLVVTGQLRG